MKHIIQHHLPEIIAIASIAFIFIIIIFYEFRIARMKTFYNEEQKKFWACRKDNEELKNELEKQKKFIVGEVTGMMAISCLRQILSEYEHGLIMISGNVLALIKKTLTDILNHE